MLLCSIPTARAGTASGQLQPRAVISETAVVANPSVVRPDQPLERDLKLLNARAYVAQIEVQVVRGRRFQVIAEVNQKPFMLMEVFPDAKQRLRVSSNGVLRVHRDEPLDGDGRIYFSNYVPDATITNGRAHLKVLLREFGGATDALVRVLPSSRLQAVAENFEELRLAAPSSVDAKPGASLTFDVAAHQRGFWPPAQHVNLSVDADQGVTGLHVSVIKKQPGELGRWRVTGRLHKPGTLRVQLLGAYNTPTILVSAQETRSGRSPIAATVLIGAPLILCLIFPLWNRMRRRRVGRSAESSTST
jgi:hypothetical protein